MTHREALLKAANPGQQPRHQSFKTLIGQFGFRLASMNRLHSIFVHPDIPEMYNLQNINGQTKPFQVRQMINLVYKYQLKATDEQ